MTFDTKIKKSVWGEERWLVSAHATAPSVIVDGPFQGQTLDVVASDFPILAKILDAKLRLSIQVHPDEHAARELGGEAKSELMVFLSDGSLYAGFLPGVTPDDVRVALHAGTLDQLLIKHYVKKGEAWMIPGGLIHALGDDTKVFEVQQCSDTTYRLSDWGRTDASGNPRQLHLAEAMTALNFSLPPPVPQHAVSCDYFDFWQEDFREETMVQAPADAALLVFDCAKESASYLLPNEKRALASGRYFLTKVFNKNKERENNK